VVGFLAPRALRIAITCGAAAVWAFLALEELGVLARLSGPYAKLALAALGGIVLSSLVLTLAVLALAPDVESRAAAERPPLFGAWLEAHGKARRALSVLLVLAVVATVAADALFLRDLYPFIHDTLRRTARLCALAAPLLLGLPTRFVQFAALALSPLVLVAMLTLDASHGAVLSAMRSAPFAALSLDDLRALLDFDRDGFPVLLGGGDCAPFDPLVNPDAQEVPGNGVDDNCRLGDLAKPVTLPPPALHAPQKPTSIVLITIDTLRADHLSSYGYRRPTSPRIDAFFAAGLRCTQAIASGAFTTITIPSLMRGVLPRKLDWVVGKQTSFFRLFPASAQPVLEPGESWLSALLLGLDARHPPLSALLAPYGFHTWAVVDDGGAAFLSPPLAGAGFERFAYMPAESHVRFDPEGDAVVAKRALEVLASRDEKPFFLWLHFYGVHGPDAQHAGVPRFGDDVIAGYDHEIASVDRELQPVFEALAAIEQERPLVTVLTSDHGERFSLEGRAHGSNLAEDEIHVPLFFRGAGVPRGSLTQMVSLVDVVPTLLVRAGVSDGRGFDGIDILDGARLAKRKVVLSDVWRYDAAGRREFDRVGAVSAQHRFVFEAGTNSRRLYERGVRGGLLLKTDPALEQAAAAYLEITGPRPLALLP
jgi:hypothetical protein